MSAESSPVSGLALRYAQALLELAEDKGKLDAVAEDLRGLRALVRDSAALRRLLRSPVIGRARQTHALLAVLDKAGVDGVTHNFVQVVAHNGRLFVLSDMADAYLHELARRRGEITAQVTSARALSDTQRQQLEQALRQSLGGTVNIEAHVDPALLGGMIVRVGSRMIDNTLRSKLNRLQHVMKGAG